MTPTQFAILVPVTVAGSMLSYYVGGMIYRAKGYCTECGEQIVGEK